MRSSIAFQLLLAGAAVALPGGGRKRDYSEGHIGRRQEGPVAPDTASDCSYYDTARTGFSTCAAFQADWDLTFDQFFDYNPSVKADCSGIKIGQSYCVEVNFGLPRPPTTNPSATTGAPTTTKASPTVTSVPKPAPTQPGLISSCTSFYFAVANDNCNKIVAAHGTFSYDDFVAWNPAVNADCSGIWANTYYCVGIPGTPSSKPSASGAPATTTSAAGPAKPKPTQDGLISTCTNFYFAVANDNCAKIVKQYGGAFSLSDFVKWNPAVNADCSGIWANTYYCVGIPGTPTAAPVTTTTPTTPSNGITTPLPTQPGMVTNCAKFHYIARGVTCSQVTSYQKISMADFVKWNPTVGDDCTGMQAEVQVCVGVIGGSTTTAPPTTTTSAGNGVTTPLPTQPGMVTNCAKFHWIARGVTCNQVISYQKISLADFVKWNPTVGNDCSGMQAEVQVCVGIIGGSTTTTPPPTTTTTAGNGVQTPQPTQPGMVTNCAKFHWIARGVTCSQVTSYQKISMSDFVKWNPTVGNDCTGMQAEVNVCVGVIGGGSAPTPTTTTPSNAVQTPQPTQPGMVTNCKKFHFAAQGVVCSQIISYQHITLEDFVKWNPGVGSDCRNMWANTHFCVGV